MLHLPDGLVDGGGGCVEEPGFRVLLTGAGDRKMEAVRAIRTVTGLSLWNSNRLLASAPVEIPAGGWPGGEPSPSTRRSTRTRGPWSSAGQVQPAATSGRPGSA
ncbi:ribosomal protein L7/L12 [Streptomyces sp. NPDC048424]|uniref:ribosomal protein L7/L12 n=1 Tax=Streptomyces sp. NPDC048424 TaxID=3155265 RepID=UPI003439E299